jgi:hypothetical protein
VEKCVKALRPNVKECIQLEVSLLNGVGDLNPYALDYPVCTSDSPAKRGRAQRLWFLNNQLSAHISKESIKALVSVYYYSFL